MRPTGILYLVTLSLLPAMVIAGQSLGSAARREKERREKKQDGKPVRTVTEEDLKAAREADKTAPRPTPLDQAGQATGHEAAVLGTGGALCCTDDGSSRSSSPRTYNGMTEDTWRERGKAAREQVEKARQKVAQLPFGIERYDTSLVTNARRDLKKAEEELARFEEEARKAGVPPGWTR